MKRRELLAGAGWVAAASTLWTLVPRAPALGAGTAAALAPAGDVLLECLCDIIIPDTDTPGARRAGVPAFMRVALEHGLAGASPADRVQLEERLNAEAGGDFLRLDAARQRVLIAQFDTAAFAGDGDPLWRRVKALVVMGYYTSEVGATQELQYALVPGRFDPDLPVRPDDRGWSSDWVGQTF